ncbi:hypothetical protein DH09_01640 [Bacillaceae bacterium JMAK1]|nr:hypothetical protein DH09_01640 [Bacillaceae bacterium JMAK1]
MKRSLHVIPCGKKKIWDVDPTHPPAYAKDAYVGTFHRICRHYVHHFDVDWVILSAKYGFLLPNDIVSHNYDLTWNISHKEDWIPMERLRDQVKEEKLHNYERIVLLTGKKYEPIVRNIFGSAFPVIRPLDGARGIGDMQAMLKHSIEQNVKLC